MFIYFNYLLPVILHFEIMNSLLLLILEANFADDEDIKLESKSKEICYV